MQSDDITYVLNFLQGNLPPKELERHKFGEVFTPLDLVDEMLHSLPHAVWSNKNLTWLDPASGIGNFPIKVLLGQDSGKYKYPGLLHGLSKSIPNLKLRCKHIIEKMLFLIDINENNNKIARMLFQKLCPHAIPNISYIDKKNGFLTKKSLTFATGAKNITMRSFDIIVGNPPFNKGAVRTALVTEKTRKKKLELGVSDSESNYWVKFINKILIDGYLKKNGYLLFIHPITWFKSDRLGAHNTILSHQLHMLKIYKNNGPGTAFGKAGKISVAWYCLENRPPTKKTTIQYGADPDLTETLQLSTESVLILRYNSIYQKILAKSKLFGNDGILKHKTSGPCNDSGKHKLISDIHDDGSMEYVMSTQPHADQNIPKIIIGGIHKPIVYYDRDGSFGIYTKGQRHYFIGTESELTNIHRFFKTKLSTLLLEYIKFEQDFIRPSYYPDISAFGKHITDASLASFYEFTDEEVAVIKSMDSPIELSKSDIKPNSGTCIGGKIHTTIKTRKHKKRKEK